MPPFRPFRDGDVVQLVHGITGNHLITSDGYRPPMSESTDYEVRATRGVQGTRREGRGTGSARTRVKREGAVRARLGRGEGANVCWRREIRSSKGLASAQCAQDYGVGYGEALNARDTGQGRETFSVHTHGLYNAELKSAEPPECNVTKKLDAGSHNGV